VKTCLSYVFCPWRLICPASDVADEKREKIRVITALEIDVEWEVKDWTVKDGAPAVDKLFHEGRVQPERTGTIEKLSDKDGEVIVSFPGDQEAVCLFTQEDGSAGGPVPKNGAGGKSWQFSVPLTALRESTPEWSFTRKLLGDEALRHQICA
jgi:hypothetical protein